VSKVEYTFGYKRNDDGKVRIFLHHSSVPYALPGSNITKDEVLECQEAWANAIQNISRIHAAGGDFVKAAADAAGELYGYGKCNVLFKPTKAASHPFRPAAADAMSYFVGCNAVDGGYEEDGGFAINGGKGWSSVNFDNHQIDLNGETAMAMGTYYFTCATTSVVSKVEYTFGYKRNDDGKVRIFLHHSSVPYAMQKSKIAKDDALEKQLSRSSLGEAVEAAWTKQLSRSSRCSVQQAAWAKVPHFEKIYTDGSDFDAILSAQIF
jgi:hypothetical protein